MKKADAYASAFLYLQIFELAKNMNKKSLNWAIAITVIWLGVIGLTWFFGSLESPKSLNELADFLAGIFAPIAFFWLILGYIQQGKQLDQNTRALEQQERALQLQINEMKESVKQQKELSKIQNEQINSTYKMVQPALKIGDGILMRLSNGNSFVLQTELENIGLGIARNIYFNIDLENGRTCIRSFDNKEQDLEKCNLEENAKVQFRAYLQADDFLKISDQHMWLLKLKVQFEDVYKNIYYEEFMAGVEKTVDENKFQVYF